MKIHGFVMRLVGFFLITSYWRMLRHRFIVPQSYKSEERSKEHPISPAKPNQAGSEPTGVLCYRILTNDCLEEDHSFLIPEREREQTFPPQSTDVEGKT